jgi:hypothetical protein
VEQLQHHDLELQDRVVGLAAGVALALLGLLRSAPRKPDVPELLSRARAITDVVRARVQETEANRRIADDVIARMREAELFRILQLLHLRSGIAIIPPPRLRDVRIAPRKQT